MEGDGFLAQINNNSSYLGTLTHKELIDYVHNYLERQNNFVTYLVSPKGWVGEQGRKKLIDEMVDLGMSEEKAESYFTPNHEIFGGSGFNFDFTDIPTS